MAKRSRASAIAFVGWAVLALAAPDQASAAPENSCKLTTLAQLPVTMVDRRALVKAMVNGVGMPFIADSGAIFSMLSPASATRLDLQRRAAPDGFTMAGVGGAIDVSLARVDSFGLAGRTLRDVDFLVGGGEAGAVGLLGQNVLSVADAEYDLGGGMIRLVDSGGCTERTLADRAGGKPVSVLDIEPLVQFRRHITGRGTINGMPLRVAFDTGAPTTLLSLAAAQRVGIKPGDPGVVASGTASGLGGMIKQSWIVPAAHYRIAGVEIHGDPLRIADIGAVPFDLLVGADFFLSHRVLAAYSQNRLYFVDMTNPPGQPLPELASADAYGRRGAALASRKDLDDAIADFTRAIAMAPKDPHYLVQRATARLDRNEALLARHDLDLALDIQPDFVEALLARATLYFADRNLGPARSDLAAASKVAPREADERFTFAALYAGLEDWRASLDQFDLWIPAHPGDYRQGAARNARCWARAMLGAALRQALDDCNAAVQLQPDDMEYFDSRGLVQLRLGDWSRAITDYDRALAKQPDLAWSLYGRGLAKLRQGREAEGRADIAAAIKLDPEMPSKAVRIGLISSASDPR